MFPGPGSSYQNNGGFDGWVGPYAFPPQFVAQDFVLAGLSVIDSATFHFSMYGNQPGATTIDRFTIFINSISIGTFDVSTLPITQNFELAFMFPSISAQPGSVYNVRFEMTSRPVPSFGAVRFSTGGTGELFLSPELDGDGATLPLVLAGILLAAFRGRRAHKLGSTRS